MEFPSFGYETYQDVRKNLFRYSTPVLVMAGMLVYFLILPPPQRDWLEHAVERLASQPLVRTIVKTASIAAIFMAIAYLLIEILKIHDRCYDRYIVRWRETYDCNFILPRLLQPVLSRANARFFEEATSHKRAFMERLYYPFVGDIDTRISRNALIRFYEVITVYWLTQINEITLVLLLAACGAYSLTHHVRADHTYAVRLLRTTSGLVVLFVLNRLWIWGAKTSVERATLDEIREVHANPELLDDLKDRFRAVCEDYGLPFV